MNAESLLAELKQVGVDLTASGDDLVVNAPAGIITEEWREKLITSKQDLLALLVPQEDKDPLLNGDRDIESEHSPSTDEPPCWVLETEDVYDRVQRAGVNIWLDAAGTLRIDKTAPEEIKQMVRGHKQDLIDFFAWSEAKAKKLNRIFEEQGATGTRSTITGATVRHGAVKRWLEEEYPVIRGAAKQEKALIYWADGMGVRSDHQAGRSYAPQGQTPAIPGTGQRFGCNVVSALTNRGHLSFMVFKKGFTASVFLQFLRRLARQARRKVFVIVDKHPVHRSKKVQAWLAQNATRIRLFFLPGYSPELNPDEMVNQDVKTNAVGRKRARNRAQLMAHVRRHLDRRRADPGMVRRYFHEPSVRYAAL